jgi:hypothetical protein
MDWTEWVLIYALVICVLANLWFIALVRHKDHKEAVELYREHGEVYRKHMELSRKSMDESQQSLDQVQESNRIRSEEVVLLRELVAELRAARQAPDPPPIRPSDSN